MPIVELKTKVPIVQRDVVEITGGILVVATCSNLSNYSAIVEQLMKRYSTYQQDLLLKTLNNNFFTINGETLFTRVGNDLTIVSIFAEYLTGGYNKELIFDAIYKGFGLIKRMRKMTPLEQIYVMEKLGTEMSDKQWTACIFLMQCFINDFIIISDIVTK